MNPVEIEVAHHRFQAIAEEMGVALMRAAFSPNIKERRDHSCALFDADGRLLAQAAHIPIHLGSMPASVEAAIGRVPMSAGQSVLLNDPYAGGTHLPDVTLVSPVFAPNEHDRPVFYAANRAHHADVGGISPGSLPLSRHIDDEGIRVEPSLLTDTLVERICAASRTPDERRGDLAAQTAANHLGLRRALDLLARHGRAALAAQADGLLAYSARLMRSVVAALPDGRYTAEDWLDDDGRGHQDLRLAVTIDVAGEACRLDFTDSDDQVDGPVNAVRAITESAVFYVMRCLGPAGMPTNAGCLAPLTVVTRSGSLLDAVHPAPVAAGNVETSQRIVDLVLKALHPALPDRIPAASTGSMGNVTMGAVQPGSEPFVYYETIGGGAGAGPEWDGASGTHTHMTNTLNTPVEALEHAYPLVLHRYELRRGSGGAGRHRGGDGIVREYGFRVATEVTTLVERHRRGPYGLAGGQPGEPARVTLIEADGSTHRLPAKGTRVFVPGERLRIETAGGGGFGS